MKIKLLKWKYLVALLLLLITKFIPNQAAAAIQARRNRQNGKAKELTQ